MLQYILVRHGESTANRDESVRHYTEECDIPLTDTGVRESVDIAKQISIQLNQYLYKGASNPVTVVLSPYLRAKQTFQHIKNHVGNDFIQNIEKVVEDVRLRELDYGTHRHKTIEEREECKRQIAKMGSAFYYQYTGGESYTTLLTRLSTLNNEILIDWKERDCPPQIVLMVAHAHVLAAFDILLMKKDISEVNYKMPNCEIRHYIKIKGQNFKRVQTAN